MITINLDKLSADHSKSRPEIVIVEYFISRLSCFSLWVHRIMFLILPKIHYVLLQPAAFCSMHTAMLFEVFLHPQSAQQNLQQLLKKSRLQHFCDTLILYIKIYWINSDCGGTWTCLFLACNSLSALIWLQVIMVITAFIDFIILIIYSIYSMDYRNQRLKQMTFLS